MSWYVPSLSPYKNWLFRTNKYVPVRTIHPSRAVGRRSDIGAEYDARLAQAEDGAGGGPAEEQTCSRGRGMLLLKIGEVLTRMRGRDGNFEWIS